MKMRLYPHLNFEHEKIKLKISKKINCIKNQFWEIVLIIFFNIHENVNTRIVYLFKYI